MYPHRSPVIPRAAQHPFVLHRRRGISTEDVVRPSEIPCLQRITRALRCARDDGSKSLLAGTARALLSALLVALLPASASAHPHVWIAAAASVRYANKAPVAIDYVWTFDEMWSATAVEGVDANGDGKISREEFAETAKANVEGMADFGYFTQAQKGQTMLAFAKPTDYWLESVDGVVKMHLTLPFASPVPEGSDPIEILVGDATFFVGFDWSKEKQAELSGDVPDGCKVEIEIDPDTGEPMTAFKIVCAPAT
jgi:ABC-type uncharacterized transport system substrate-binding protein